MRSQKELRRRLVELLDALDRLETTVRSVKALIHRVLED